MEMMMVEVSSIVIKSGNDDVIGIMTKTRKFVTRVKKLCKE